MTLTAEKKNLILNKIFYVPNLETNLLSGNKLCAAGLLRLFNIKYIQLIDKQDKIIVKLNRKRGVYYVSNIKGDHAYFVLIPIFYRDAEATYNASVSPISRNDSNMLWHRRICHIGHAKLAGILKIADCNDRI